LKSRRFNPILRGHFRGNPSTAVVVPATLVKGREENELLTKRDSCDGKMPMTAEGLAQLQKERERLMTVERPEVVRAIGAARETRRPLG